jgi:hypothetical protein
MLREWLSDVVKHGEASISPT